jgi:hypothetical protein
MKMFLVRGMDKKEQTGGQCNAKYDSVIYWLHCKQKASHKKKKHQPVFFTYV